MNKLDLILLNDDERLEVPKYATIGSAGIDLQANIQEKVIILAGQSQLIGTGLKIHIKDPSLFGFITPRSGKGNAGFGIKNLVGIIDSDYQGELLVSVWNTNVNDPITVNPFDKIAQMLFLNVNQVGFNVVKQWGEITARGEGGFGHTDLKLSDDDVNLIWLNTNGVMDVTKDELIDFAYNTSNYSKEKALEWLLDIRTPNQV